VLLAAVLMPADRPSGVTWSKVLDLIFKSALIRANV
jgi:hypothetical protein